MMTTKNNQITTFRLLSASSSSSNSESGRRPPLPPESDELQLTVGVAETCVSGNGVSIVFIIAFVPLILAIYTKIPFNNLESLPQ
jgi:hypothetical protein